MFGPIDPAVLQELYEAGEFGDVGVCRMCGCTDEQACPDGCWWVRDPEGLGDLCSRCRDELEAEAALP